MVGLYMLVRDENVLFDYKHLNMHEMIDLNDWYYLYTNLDYDVDEDNGQMNLNANVARVDALRDLRRK